MNPETKENYTLTCILDVTLAWSNSNFFFYHVRLQRKLPSTVLAQVESSEDLKSSLSHRRDHTGDSGGLSGPVAHRQNTNTQVHTL